VTRLDRIGRSVGNLVEVVSDLDGSAVDLVVLDQAFDTTSRPGGCRSISWPRSPSSSAT
jgi:DNA invertase Pin-like site-specific DNA recombinase